MRGNATHGGEARRSCSTKQIEQGRFDQIIGMMGEENGAAATSPRDEGEEGKTSGACRRLDGQFRFGGEFANVSQPDLARQVERAGQSRDKARVCLGTASTQLVIEVADDEAIVAVREKLMQKSHGIAAGRDADEVPALRWNIAQKSFWIE